MPLTRWVVRLQSAARIDPTKTNAHEPTKPVVFTTRSAASCERFYVWDKRGGNNITGSIIVKTFAVVNGFCFFISFCI
jgi:hypothetical protein